MENNQNTQNHENNMLLNNFKYLYTLAQEYTEQDKFETMQRKKQEHDGQIAQYQATITYHDGERVRLDAILVELAKRYVFLIKPKRLLFNALIIIFFSWNIRYETVFRDYEVSENLLKQHQSILKKAVGDWEAVTERIDTEKLIVSKVK